LSASVVDCLVGAERLSHGSSLGGCTALPRVPPLLASAVHPRLRASSSSQSITCAPWHSACSRAPSHSSSASRQQWARGASSRSLSRPPQVRVRARHSVPVSLIGVWCDERTRNTEYRVLADDALFNLAESMVQSTLADENLEFWLVRNGVTEVLCMQKLPAAPPRPHDLFACRSSFERAGRRSRGLSKRQAASQPMRLSANMTC